MTDYGQSIRDLQSASSDIYRVGNALDRVGQHQIARKVRDIEYDIDNAVRELQGAQDRERAREYARGSSDNEY